MDIIKFHLAQEGPERVASELSPALLCSRRLGVRLQQLMENNPDLIRKGSIYRDMY